MKSNFSRFLHHKPSHSDVNPQSATISSPSGLTRWSRSNQVANLFHLDIRVKPEYDNFCAGRSMVEMLGVLAIIGVLSVGAIAGYSKAMFKYKLNKHAEQMNTLINAVARNIHSFDNIKENSAFLTPYFIKMGEIPTEMIKQNQTNLIYDIFGQAWKVFIGGNQGNGIYLSSYSDKGASSLTSKSADNLEICKNILIAAKENSSNIYSVYTVSNHHTDDKEQPLLVGDSLCTSRRKCLKNLTLNDIYEICTKHYGVNSVTGTEFAITWNR